MLSMLRRPWSGVSPGHSFRPVAAVLRWPVFALGAALASGDASAITGVCPDGSVFVVQRSADIPCSNARRVESSQVPPMRPENLPRPFLWEVHREKQNENNPYNLVERAERVRSGLAQGGASGAPGGAALEAAREPGSGASLPQVASAPPTTPAAPPAPRKPDLGLTDGDLRDLFYLVELSQQSAPATFVEEAAGAESMRVSFAHSAAFEQRLRGAAAVEGTVVLFSVQPKQPQRFQPNFTFVQGQTAFRPQPGRSQEMDVLVGPIGGQLTPETLVLGYAVLPSSIDASRPVDLYWDDRRIAVTFRP
jgi:hypothetical protein